MEDMVEVVIDSIRVSLMSQQRIVILREQDEERYLPIWIGVYEAESITIALQEVEVSRPLTHDLIRNVFNQLNARVIRVEVISLRDDTFYGNIVAESNGHTFNIDARPSDALAIAVRTHVPIFVSQTVMNAASIIPEDDIQDQEPKMEMPADEAIGDERLSVFEDFLERLDTDKPDAEEDTDSETGNDDIDEDDGDPNSTV